MSEALPVPPFWASLLLGPVKDEPLLKAARDAVHEATRVRDHAAAVHKQSRGRENRRDTRRALRAAQASLGRARKIQHRLEGAPRSVALFFLILLLVPFGGAYLGHALLPSEGDRAVVDFHGAPTPRPTSCADVQKASYSWEEWEDSTESPGGTGVTITESVLVTDPAVLNVFSAAKAHGHTVRVVERYHDDGVWGHCGGWYALAATEISL